jgi:hypothetical protein
MSVLAYIEETSPPEVRDLLTTTHHLLQETLPPFAACAIKWRIPFYILRQNFCYLNRHRDHITLGFPHGWKLSPRPDVLLGENENLKYVRYLEIFTVEDLYSERTQQILHEAIILDEMSRKSKNKFGRKKNKTPLLLKFWRIRFPKLARRCPLPLE